MTEALLHYIWKMRLYSTANLRTTDGEPLEVIYPGAHNNHAGPDFSHARIRIGQTLWAGNVELHTQSSHWFDHGHQNDAAYKNVILHVVYEHDIDHFPIPTLALTSFINPDLLKTYRFLMETASWIPCARHINGQRSLIWKEWVTRMTIERLEDKAERLKNRWLVNKANWDETAWQVLARTLGAPVNAEPMEQLAVALPLKILAKYAGHRTDVEALLLGQAGFLEGRMTELYPLDLQNRFQHFRKLYGLEPFAPHIWKFGRMRPAHFPTLRISQLADIISKDPRLFHYILHEEKTHIESFFEAEAAPYWKEHFHFKSASSNKAVYIGATMKRSLLINTAVPLMVLYGKETDQGQWIDRAIQLLELLPAEENQVIKNWKMLGIVPEQAADSQGLLHLYQHWCREKRCLDCQIGYQILQKVIYI